MPKSRIIALAAGIIFALGIGSNSPAVAGEKNKGRGVFHQVKGETIEVGDEEGHILMAYEYKGIGLGVESPLPDGMVCRGVGLLAVLPRHFENLFLR
jgi:hypothetical protein